MKRYIYIIIGIIVIAAIAIAIIFYLKNPSSSSSLFGFGSSGSLPQTGTQGSSTGQQSGVNGSQNTSSTNNASSNTAAQGGLVQTFGIVADGPVLDYFVDAQNTITAIKPDGTVIVVSNGSSSTISSTTINNIIAASFSYNGKKILVSSGDPNSPQTNIFDVTSKTWTSIPQGLRSPQWSPSTYQIAYLSQSTSGILSLSTIDASNLKKAPATIFSLHAIDMSLQWVSKTQFILADKPTSNVAESIWIFDSLKNTITPIIYETSGVESVWGNTASGTLGLVFQSTGGNSSLKLVTPSGTTYHALTFLTLPSKCAFATGTVPTASSSITSSYLYCGIPADSSLPSSAQLPDDYNMMSLFTSDTITRINASSGEEDVLWNDPTQNIDTTDLKFFNKTLFFVNRYDQKLYALTLVTPSSTTQ
jgi:hypothetical protein